MNLFAATTTGFATGLSRSKAANNSLVGQLYHHSRYDVKKFYLSGLLTKQYPFVV
jgi:hypothetical protein